MDRNGTGTLPSAATRPAGDCPAWRPLALRFGLPLGLTLILDLATKAWFFRDGSLGEARLRYADNPWIEPHVNTGVAWSLLNDHPELVTGMTLVLIPLLAVAWWHWFRGQGALEDVAFGFILGGALGNAWDRLTGVLSKSSLGGVRDFISVDLHHIGIPYVWPTFNVADAGISIGFVALILSSFRGKRKAAPQEPSP